MQDDERYNDYTLIKETRFRKDTRLLEESVPSTEARKRKRIPQDGEIPTALKLILPDLPATFEVQLKKYMVMGRRGTSHDNDVHIDFMPYGAQEYGVSRLHAVIMVTQEGLKIKDLNSTNGTHVNGEKLSPLDGYILRDGDELLVGKLRVHVHFAGKRSHVK